MTTDDPVLRAIARANPVAPRELTPAESAHGERLLAKVTAQPSVVPVKRFDGWARRFVPALGVLVTVGLVAVVLTAGHSTHHPASSPTRITLRAKPTPQVKTITPAALTREAALLRLRLAALGTTASVSTAGHDEIVVRAASGAVRDRSALIGSLLSAGSGLAVYDWEGNVIAPSGRVVASLLSGPATPTALQISQGRGAPSPGAPGAGGLTLYRAVRLAARQPATPTSNSLSRLGPEYYLFGRPGSTDCLARVTGSRSPCYLAGPASTPAELRAQAPAGLNSAGLQTLRVNQGTTILQATTGTLSALGAPGARFFVLHDRVALGGQQITNAAATTGPGGVHEVHFDFTTDGQQSFQTLTAAVAQRGARLPSGVYQHIAIAFAGTIVTVPQINSQEFPNGIHSTSASIAGDLTARGAARLAAQLRVGATPLALQLVDG